MVPLTEILLFMTLILIHHCFTKHFTLEPAAVCYFIIQGWVVLSDKAEVLRDD